MSSPPLPEADGCCVDARPLWGLQAVAPGSLKPLLRDLFEVNTFWQIETERATAVETEAGTWQVRLHVQARKKVYDSAGVETEVPMDEWVEYHLLD